MSLDYEPYTGKATEVYFDGISPVFLGIYSVESVKRNMDSNSDPCELIEEGTMPNGNAYLMYQGQYKEDHSEYLFDSSGTLERVYFIFRSSIVSLSDMQDYLSNNLMYTYKGTSEDSLQYFYLVSNGTKQDTYAVAWKSELNGVDITVLAYVLMEKTKARDKFNNLK